MASAWDSLNVESFLSCFHEDYEFIWHSMGKVTNFQNTYWDRLASVISTTVIKNHRCLYKNNDILVTHQFGTYPNGNCNTTMAVYLKRGRLIVRQETGVPLLISDQ